MIDGPVPMATSASARCMRPAAGRNFVQMDDTNLGLPVRREDA